MSTSPRLDYETLERALRPDPLPAEPPEADLPTERVLRPDPLAGVLQVHDSYILAEDEGGVVIIDQHALHERVMFEFLSQRLAVGNLQSQRLLVPETIDLAESQMALLEELAPLLEKIGIDASPIGPRTLAVHGFPTFLFEKKVEPGAFVRDLFDLAEGKDFVPTEEEALREVVDMMSCKAAVKAGDRLRPEEIRRLLELRDEVERSSSCPHGRPTSIRLSLTELEKLFHRR